MKVKFETRGDGYWSNKSKKVTVTNIRLEGVMLDGKRMFGELRVYFSPKSWDTYKHGLIYTDSLFLKQLRKFLKSYGFPASDVNYSEQGMQGDDYVSLDAGNKFCKEWIKVFPETEVDDYEMERLAKQIVALEKELDEYNPIYNDHCGLED